MCKVPWQYKGPRVFWSHEDQKGRGKEGKAKGKGKSSGTPPWRQQGSESGGKGFAASPFFNTKGKDFPVLVAKGKGRDFLAAPGGKSKGKGNMRGTSTGGKGTKGKGAHVGEHGKGEGEEQQPTYADILQRMERQDARERKEEQRLRKKEMEENQPHKVGMDMADLVQKLEEIDLQQQTGGGPVPAKMQRTFTEAAGYANLLLAKLGSSFRAQGEPEDQGKQYQQMGESLLQQAKEMRQGEAAGRREGKGIPQENLPKETGRHGKGKGKGKGKKGFQRSEDPAAAILEAKDRTGRLEGVLATLQREKYVAEDLGRRTAKHIAKLEERIESIQDDILEEGQIIVQQTQKLAAAAMPSVDRKSEGKGPQQAQQQSRQIQSQKETQYFDHLWETPYEGKNEEEFEAEDDAYMFDEGSGEDAREEEEDDAASSRPSEGGENVGKRFKHGNQQGGRKKLVQGNRFKKKAEGVTLPGLAKQMQNSIRAGASREGDDLLRSLDCFMAKAGIKQWERSEAVPSMAEMQAVLGQLG